MEVPEEIFRPIAERIHPLMSPLDVAAHIDDGEFAVLLCSSDGADAFRFARLLYGRLTGQSLLPEGIEAKESVAIGAAALPETCGDPGELLAAARQAKDLAQETSRPYLLYP
jgi:GGDEF domain-containing protein